MPRTDRTADDRSAAEAAREDESRAERESLFGCMKGTAHIVGDIEGPAVPPEEWEVLRD